MALRLANDSAVELNPAVPSLADGGDDVGEILGLQQGRLVAATATHTESKISGPNNADRAKVMRLSDGRIRIIVADGVSSAADPAEAAEVLMNLTDARIGVRQQIVALKAGLDKRTAAGPVITGHRLASAACVGILDILPDGRAKAYNIGDCIVYVTDPEGRIQFTSTERTCMADSLRAKIGKEGVRFLEQAGVARLLDSEVTGDMTSQRMNPKMPVSEADIQHILRQLCHLMPYAYWEDIEKIAGNVERNLLTALFASFVNPKPDQKKPTIVEESPIFTLEEGARFMVASDAIPDKLGPREVSRLLELELKRTVKAVGHLLGPALFDDATLVVGKVTADWFK